MTHQKMTQIDKEGSMVGGVEISFAVTQWVTFRQIVKHGCMAYRKVNAEARIDASTWHDA